MTSLRWSASITPVVTDTAPTPGDRPDVGLDVALDLGAQGAAGHGEGHLDLHRTARTDARWR